jgi:hypothetical protein
LEHIDSTAELFVCVFAGLGVPLRLLSTQTEATASPDAESDYHTIIRDTEKATGELVLFSVVERVGNWMCSERLTLTARTVTVCHSAEPIERLAVAPVNINVIII